MKKASVGPHPDAKPACEQIDAIILTPGDWRGPMLADLRAVIRKAVPSAIEEVKWKKPSNPLGVPVWSRDGILCVADILKAAVRLTFPKGAQLKDPKRLFNTRLDSKTVRAIDFREGEAIKVSALKALVVEAAKVNASKERPISRKAKADR